MSASRACNKLMLSQYAAINGINIVASLTSNNTPCAKRRVKVLPLTA